jgi:hypothetical protein
MWSCRGPCCGIGSVLLAVPAHLLEAAVRVDGVAGHKAQLPEADEALQQRHAASAHAVRDVFRQVKHRHADVRGDARRDALRSKI